MRAHRDSRLAPHRLRSSVACGVAAIALIAGCDDGASDDASSGGASSLDDGGFYESDTPLHDDSGAPGDVTAATDTASPSDTAAPQDTEQGSPQDVGVDAILEDGFNRPDISAMDSGASDTAAEDAPSTAATIEGSQDCLGYTLETQSTVFTLKVDNFFITYTIRNECNRPIRMRVEHESDMFPVGIQKNGEPWVFLPDCPGTGRPFERTFNGGDGWRRGWFWTADDHDARLARCGVTFEEGAEYSIVGYGLTEVPATGSDVWSELFPMTEPIPITLVTSGE
ncbi:MAG: hypothetical protein CMH57_03310 [Myxococcales bacterium]|nr:hypothetical protein [Myxococcales bacterium]